MGICTSKPPAPNPYARREDRETLETSKHNGAPGNGVTGDADDYRSKDVFVSGKRSPFFAFYSPSPAHHFLSKKSPASSSAAGSANATPRRFFKRPFPPPSPAKHIKAVLAKRHGTVKPNNAASIPKGEEREGGDVAGLDKSFGFSKQFTSRYEVGAEVGRGHFGYTCSARSKKGDLKGQQVAVKVIPKAKV